MDKKLKDDKNKLQEKIKNRDEKVTGLKNSKKNYIKNNKSNLDSEFSLNSKSDLSKLKITSKLKKNGNSIYFYLAIISSCIAGFLFDFDAVKIFGPIILKESQSKLTFFELTLKILSFTILSIFYLSISNYFASKLGRKKTILISSIIFLIGSLTIAAKSSVDFLFLFVKGFFFILAFGISSISIPIYIAEISQFHQRATFIICYCASIIAGQFIGGLTASFYSIHDKEWRYMGNFVAIPSIIQIICSVLSPESPRYLLKIGKEKDALKCLKRLRSDKTLAETEFKRIKSHFIKTREDNETILGNNFCICILKIIEQIKSNVVLRKSVILGCALQLIQQRAGISTIIYFSSTVIKMADAETKLNKIFLASLPDLANFLFVFPALIFVDKLGRRKLILFSVTGVCLSLLFLSGLFYTSSYKSPLNVTHPDKLNLNSSCSSFSSCKTCISKEDCGFCFVRNETKNIYHIKSTCLPVNQNNIKYSKNGWCSNDFNQNSLPFDSIYSQNQPIFTAFTCPTNYPAIIIIGLILYLAMFSYGLSVIPIVMNSEIYPINYRVELFSLALLIGWVTNLFVSLTFLSFFQFFSEAGTFLIYFFFSFFGLIYFYFNLPETKGLELEEIENLFESKSSANNFSFKFIKKKRQKIVK